MLFQKSGDCGYDSIVNDESEVKKNGTAYDREPHRGNGSAYEMKVSGLLLPRETALASRFRTWRQQLVRLYENQRSECVSCIRALCQSWLSNTMEVCDI